LRFSSFAGDGGCHRRQGKEEEEDAPGTPIFSGFPAAAREPTRRQ